MEHFENLVRLPDMETQLGSAHFLIRPPYLVTVEGWGEEIFAEGVGVKWKNERGVRGRGRKNISSSPPPTAPTLITIQDVGIVSLIYLAFRSKITPTLQANVHQALNYNCLRSLANNNAKFLNIFARLFYLFQD